MKKFVLLLAILAIAGYAHAEMLTNPGFENMWTPANTWATAWSGWGSGSGSGWGGWAWYSGGPTWPNDGTAYEGDRYMETSAMSATYSSWWGWGWTAAWQSGARIPAAEGVEYTLSAYIRNGYGDGFIDVIPEHPDPCDPCSMIPKTGPAILKIEFYGTDPCGLPFMISNPRDFYAIDNDWALETFSAVAPAGTVGIQAVLGTEWNMVSVDWDNASLVPEPVTLTLLGMGCLFIRRRKK